MTSVLALLTLILTIPPAAARTKWKKETRKLFKEVSKFTDPFSGDGQLLPRGMMVQVKGSPLGWEGAQS